MITIKEAEEILKHEYHIDNYLFMVKELILPDYVSDTHEVVFNNNIFESVTQLGYSSKCEVSVFEVLLKEGAQNRRVTITQEMFRILRGQGVSNAIVAFSNADKRNYRLSLLTSKYEFDGNKIVKVLSNPRRYSYSLGYGTKTKTAYDFLISKGKVHSLDELIGRFSLEIVNKHFYNEIAASFTKLIGGKRDGKTFEKELNIYSVTNQNKYAEFAVRLIGRIVFCWFLKEKKSENGIPLIPEKMLSAAAIAESSNYYHDVLEPLFFELLNTNQNRRKGKFAHEEIYKQIPYLNGGLFAPHLDDKYKYSPATQTGQYGIVTIPNEWFDHFFSVLSQYNFTVDENTSYDIELSIDPEMLGRIFENLLAEINPETGENAKKSTGSFYTPRDIVDYMVDNSIFEYLKSKTGIDNARLKALISYSKDDDDIAVFTKEEKKAIINALYTITVLDPACGSGAFPIGMLQKIVYMLQEIDPEANLWFDKATENVSFLIKKEFEKKFNAGSLDYIRKLSVIQNSIFGVDIQPIAVEIARLRCFLSLVIEEKVMDTEFNRGINPLPSLDFKFIIANSLIPLEESKQISLFENQDHIEELKAVREEYFNADNERKAELREEFSDIQKRMLQTTIDQYTKLPSKRYELLYRWSPFKNEATDWFDPEWMFGVKNGFDIVIANPPYIQLQKAISEKAKTKLGDLYQKCNFKTFTKTGDIYCLFYEKGLDLLKHEGILTYITSNKWMRAGYGENLRHYLSQFNPKLLVDFGGEKIFETATVDVNILIITKEINKKQTLACKAKEECRNNLESYISRNSNIINLSTNATWVILNSIEYAIKEKIERLGTPLQNWDLNINRGVLTGLNEAFIIDDSTKYNLIAEDPHSAEIIKPLLRGRDIKRYNCNFAGLWLINTHNGIKERYIKPVDINDYPAIKKHLDKYYHQLSTRADKGDTPYNLRNCAYLDDFSKEKLIYPETTQGAYFVYDNGKYVIDKTCFMITGTSNLLYLQATLSSQLFQYAYKKIFSSIELGSVGYQYNKHALILLPIIKDTKLDASLLSNIVKLAQDIANAKQSGINSHFMEETLNTIIYHLYELSPEEIALVEESVK